MQQKKYRRTEVKKQKWDKPTMKMLMKELSVTTNPKRRSEIKRKIEDIKTYLTHLPETITYYPNR